MQVIDRGQHEAGRPRPDLQPGAGTRRRRILRACLALGVVGLLALAAGFVWFVWRVPDHEPVLDGKADAIVVLTGGSSRVIDGIELLAAGRGQRLLISGVHRATNTGEISRVAPEHE